MKLENKRDLAARSLNVGRNRITFNSQRLSEIKEAITKQDIKDLNRSGAISIKEVHGRRKVKKRKTRKSGSVKKKVNKGKKNYIILTRKLRRYLSSMKDKGKISPEKFVKLRNEIRMSSVRSLAHMKELFQGEKND